MTVSEPPWDALLGFHCSHLQLMVVWTSLCLQLVFTNWKASSVGLTSRDWLGCWRISWLFLCTEKLLGWFCSVLCVLSIYPMKLCPISFCSFWMNLSREHSPVHFRIHPSTSVNRLVLLAVMHASAITLPPIWLTDWCVMLSIMSCSFASFLFLSFWQKLQVV